jgi:hypothetical protein
VILCYAEHVPAKRSRSSEQVEAGSRGAKRSKRLGLVPSRRLCFESTVGATWRLGQPRLLAYSPALDRATALVSSLPQARRPLPALKLQEMSSSEEQAAAKQEAHGGLVKAVHDRDVLLVLFHLEQLAEPRRRALTAPSKPIPPATVVRRSFRRAVTPATLPRAPAAQLSSPCAKS